MLILLTKKENDKTVAFSLGGLHPYKDRHQDEENVYFMRSEMLRQLHLH